MNSGQNAPTFAVMRDERLFALFADLGSLPGIGPKTKPVLERLVGGEHIWDALLHLPQRWLDRRVREGIDACEIDEVATVKGTVHAYSPPYSSKAPHKIKLFDGTSFLTLIFFRADGRWLQGQFPIGAERLVSGRITEYDGERQMTHPDHIVDPAKGKPPPAVEPIYNLTAGLTNKRVHSAMLGALSALPDDLDEWIDLPLLSQENWPSFQDAFRRLHAPTAYDLNSFDRARARLAYDEALAREAAFARARAQRRKRKAASIPTAIPAQQNIVATLPYTPTDAQTRSLNEISDDLKNTWPMRRMLQGDVGSGKTLVGTLAAVQAVEANFQVAFMAPTEVLARQQFKAISEVLSPAGYEVAALTSRDKGAAREATLMGLADGSIQIIAGTHALFQEKVQFKNLGLIVVDEQHRFGVMDRARLAEKGLSPHMLVMSATPIPRTLAMAVNGDLETSVLDEKPAGRRPVETRALPDTRIDDVVEAVGRAVGRGERAFWVCPKVDLGDDESSAVSRHRSLTKALKANIGLVHGRMKPAEKDDALEAFRSGESQVLVATTVIEVGVDVPDATIMVIERAEGFGLAQLHQLRGRVGRGSKAAFCLLLYRAPLGEIAKERLETLRRSQDGFEIAEMDFKLRGGGDILGLRQSGAVTFKILLPDVHASLIEVARKDIGLQVEKDPEFKSPRGQNLGLLRDLLAAQPSKSG